MSAMDSHINFRMSSQDKKVIEMAASLKGYKPNTYARQKLLEIAQKDILEMSQIHSLILNEKEWLQFVAIMEAPLQLNDNLKKAIQDFNLNT